MALFRVGTLVFEWDDAKADSNETKHDVSFTEALMVFDDDLGSIMRDTIHSEIEDRFLLIGSSDAQRILTVVYVERGEHIRIISARQSTPRERRHYEQRILGR